MKITPVRIFSRNERQNAMLREYMRQEVNKMNKIIRIIPPEQKQEPIQLISELEQEKISEKIRQFNKEIFGN